VPSGSIEKLPSGRWRAVVRAGRDPITKKYVRLTETCRTESEAIGARERMLAQVEADSHPDRAATVAVLMTRWMDVVDHQLSTAETTAGYVRRTINPAIGDLTLRKLQHRVDILDRLYIHLRRCNVLCDGRPFVDHTTARRHECGDSKCATHRCKPMSPAAVRRVHAILSSSLNYAVSWGWIEKNPAAYAHPPKLARRRARPPEPEEVAQLLNLAWTADLELGVFLWLAVTTGARRGELTALRWTCAEVDRGQLVIARNYVVRAGQRVLKSTKTDEDRQLSLDAASVQILKEFRRAREEVLLPARLELPEDAFIFSPAPMGDRPWHPDHFTHAYREVADQVGITEPLKNLRHFNATQLLAAGIDLRTTAGRLGHGDGGATTLKVYASWTRPADQRAVDLLAGDLVELRRKAAENGVSVIGSELLRVAKPIQDVLTPAPSASTYLEVAAGLREAVAEGRIQPGDLVPTVTDLAEWFSVARSTAQRAVTALGAESLIVRRGPRWVVATSLVNKVPISGRKMA
jgi:integrase